MADKASSLLEGARALASSFRGIRVADAADNERILDYVQNRRMDLQGEGNRSLVVNYRREPDYFAFLALQGNEHVVYLQEDDTGSIQGLGSFTYRDGFWQGSRARVGYVGDLRIAPYRLGQVQWRKLYAAHLALARAHGVAAHFTAILDDNRAARRALVEEASAKNGYAYDTLFRYRMVNVLGNVPTFRKRASGGVGSFLVRRAEGGTEGNDAMRLKDFLARVHAQMPFGADFEKTEWAFRAAHWPGLDVSRFLVATGPAGEWVACCLPWTPRGAKSVLLERCPLALKAARLALNALGAKPPVPAEGEPLHFLYLTHLIFAPCLLPEERARCLESFIAHARRDAKVQGCHFVSFHDPDGPFSLAQRLAFPCGGGLVIQTVPVTLYSVRERVLPAFDAAAAKVQESGVGFELALI
jgi:hypothetical protein